MSRNDVLLKSIGATREQRQNLAVTITSFFKLFFGLAAILIMIALVALIINYLV
ncbi:hypothetical protein [Sulfitobacter sp.]|uniref:hypothetical protein n=1 Tax=Sulfitobacter sp. TaxID=1903071 RepID=UPI003002FFA5